MKTTDYARHAPCATTGLVTTSQPWIMVIPVISTAHIRPEDDKLLDTELVERTSTPHMGTVNGIGHLLSIDDLSEWQPPEAPAYSDAFLHLLETFHHLGYHHLRLDRDGDLLDDLPQFEW